MKTKLLGTALAAGFAVTALMAAAPASAAIVFTFTPGGSAPTAGFTVIDDFNSGAPLNLSGSGFQIKNPPADGNGAPPANSDGSGYLSVLGGGTATLNLGGMFSSIQFDWGSIDSYNTLSVDTTGADPTIIPGATFTNPANGDQVSPGTNGLFTITGTAGEKFNSITLTSSQNSFEIDNLAVAGGVPEPAAWSMMIMGFGLAGGMMRAKRRGQAFA